LAIGTNQDWSILQEKRKKTSESKNRLPKLLGCARGDGYGTPPSMELHVWVGVQGVALSHPAATSSESPDTDSEKARLETYRIRITSKVRPRGRPIGGGGKESKRFDIP